MNMFKNILCGSVMVLAVFVLTGCGNIFDPFVSHTTGYDLTAAQNALRNGNYSGAISSATSVINSGTASSADVSDAYATRGEATLMGELSSDFSSLISAVSDTTASSDLTSIVSTASASAFAGAAADYNAADANGTLSDSDQTNRALANLGAVASTINNLFTSDGSINTSTYASTSDAVDSMLNSGMLDNLINAGDAVDSLTSTSDSLLGGSTGTISKSARGAKKIKCAQGAYSGGVSSITLAAEEAILGTANASADLDDDGSTSSTITDTSSGLSSFHENSTTLTLIIYNEIISYIYSRDLSGLNN